MPRRRILNLVANRRRQLKLDYLGYPDQTFYMAEYLKKGINEDEITAFAQQKSNELHRRSPRAGCFEVVLLYDSGLYRSGDLTIPGDEVDLWNQDHYDVKVDIGELIGFQLVFSLPRK